MIAVVSVGSFTLTKPSSDPTLSLMYLVIRSISFLTFLAFLLSQTE